MNDKSHFFVPSLVLSNVMSLSPKIDELRQFAKDHEPTIMCFTETWLKDIVDNNAISIDHYSLIRKDRIRAQHGGVCLYVRDSIPATVLTEYDVGEVEILWCKLRPNRLPRGFSHLIVATVYHPPTADDALLISHIIDTLSKIESTMPNAAIIIAGDFNRLNIKQIANQFRLKQLVKFPTRGERTLDLILTNFQIQPKKCKEIRISFKQVPSNFSNLHINGNFIEVVDSFQVLGMTIQSNLKWDQHVEKICKKASKRLYFLSQLKRAKVPTKDLVNFYITCIRPVLTYACEVFNFSLQDNLKSLLERIQKRAMRIIHGFDTPYDVALELSSLERLSDYRDNFCDEFLSKISNNTEDKLFKYLPFNTNINLPIRNIRKFSVPKCNTDRFKNSFINITASRYNEFYCT